MRRSPPPIDVFAWGAVMVYAATGTDAFEGPSQAAVLRRVLMDEPDLEGVPDSLRPIVARCLTKEVAARPSSRQLLGELLGYGGSEDSSADQGEVLTRGEDVGTGRVSLPPGRVAADAGGQPDRVGSVEGGPVPPRGRSFVFRSREFVEPQDLAEAMQQDWDGAVALLQSAPQRQALGRWLPETVPGRARLSQMPASTEDADLQVAWLIAHLGPGLSPCYRDVDMSLSSLLTPDGVLADWVGQERRLFPLFQAGLLEPLSQHHCTEPVHECPPNAPCAHYIEFARDARRVFEVGDAFVDWVRPVSELFEDGRFHLRLDPSRVLSDVSAVQRRDLDADAMADTAVRGVPRGEAKDHARRAVLEAPEADRWLVALVVREAAPVIKALNDSLSQFTGLQRVLEQAKREREKRANLHRELDRINMERAFGGGSAFLFGLAALCLVVLLPVARNQDQGILTAVFVVVGVAMLVVAFLPMHRKGMRLWEVRQSINKVPYRTARPFKGLNGRKTTPQHAQAQLKKAMEQLPQLAHPDHHGHL